MEVIFGTKLIQNNREVDFTISQNPLKINWPAKSDRLYTIAVYDISSPSPVDPLYSPFLHFLAVNIPGTNISKGEILAKYVPPLLFSDSESHVFVVDAYEQTDLISSVPMIDRIQYDPTKLEGLKLDQRLTFYVKSQIIVQPSVSEEKIFLNNNQCFHNSKAQVELAATVAFTEGPTVDQYNNVFFTDVTNNRIMKLSTNGKLSTFRQPSNRAFGLVFDQQWRLLACEGSDAEINQPRVTRTNMITGEIEIIADQYKGKHFHEPNDLTFDGKGRIYFTDRPGLVRRPDQTGVHAVYRIDPDGTITQIIREPDIEKPNGVMISPDDKILYLIESHSVKDGARMIRAYDLQSDGSVTNMRVFHNFYPGRSGDGMTIDSEGNLYVAAGLHLRRGTSETLDTKCGVYVFSSDGILRQFIPIPEDTITNCAFGGSDLKILYITAGKSLFKVRTQIVGTRR